MTKIEPALSVQGNHERKQWYAKICTILKEPIGEIKSLDLDVNVTDAELLLIQKEKIPYRVVIPFAPKKNAQGVPIAEVIPPRPNHPPDPRLQELERAVRSIGAVDGPGHAYVPPIPKHLDPLQMSTRQWIAKLFRDLTFREMNQIADEMKKCTPDLNSVHAMNMAQMFDDWAHTVHEEDEASYADFPRLSSSEAASKVRTGGAGDNS
jgi:hypothetical protein